MTVGLLAVMAYNKLAQLPLLADTIGNYSARSQSTTSANPGEIASMNAGVTPDKYAGAETIVNQLNETVLDIVKVIGIVVVALGVIKLVIALADNSPVAKINASTLIALGFVMIGGKTILTSMTAISTAKDEQGMVQPVLDVISEGFFWPGIIVLCIVIFKFIMSMATERPEEKMEASKLIAVGAVLMSASTIVDGIAGLVLNSSDDVSTAGQVGAYIVLDIIVPVAAIIGVIMTAYGGLIFAEAFKDEDPNHKAQASKTLIVGILLMGSMGIVNMIF